VQSAILSRSGGEAIHPLARDLAAGCTAQALTKVLEHLQKCTQYALGNVSPAAICGYLEWALR